MCLLPLIFRADPLPACLAWLPVCTAATQMPLLSKNMYVIRGLPSRFVGYVGEWTRGWIMNESYGMGTSCPTQNFFTAQVQFCLWLEPRKSRFQILVGLNVMRAEKVVALIDTQRNQLADCTGQELKGRSHFPATNEVGIGFH